MARNSSIPQTNSLGTSEDTEVHQGSLNNDGQSSHTTLSPPNPNSISTPISSPTHDHREPIQVNGSRDGLSPADYPQSRLYEIEGSGNLAPRPVAMVGSEPPKQRGRPRGSKNKPKGVVVNYDHGLLNKAHVLEIPCGLDIVEMIQQFGQVQQVGVIVHNGKGRVTNVTVQTDDTSVFRGGVHDLVAISGSHIGPAIPRPPMGLLGRGNGSYSNPNEAQNNLTVILREPRLGLWGGPVVGRLVAASTVTLHVTTFGCYEFHQLGPEFLAQVQHASASPSTSGLKPSPNLVSNYGVRVGNELDWKSNLSGLKRPRFSGN